MKFGVLAKNREYGDKFEEALQALRQRVEPTLEYTRIDSNYFHVWTKAKMSRKDGNYIFVVLEEAD